MQRSYIIALAIALAAGAWLASPLAQEYLAPPEKDADSAPAAQSAPAEEAAPAVRVAVRHSVARERVNELVLTGQTEPSRSATIKAETEGRVVAVEAAEGATVQEGDVIVKLAMNDRSERLDEAKALLRQRNIEYEAARKLESKGFQSQTKLAEARSLLESAQAQLKRIELDIEYTVIKAPFEGVLQDRMVEVGDYLGIGDPIAVIVDLDPLLAVAQLSERESAHIAVGAPGRARLVTGHKLDGVIRYISAVGAAGTRTFRVELEIQNGGKRLPAGLTAELSLPVASVEAHLMSPAALTLNDVGIVGIKTVDENDIVQFRPVTLVGDGPEGVWVGGLPREATIITIGQEFVLPGQKVIPVPDDSHGLPAQAGGQS